MARLAPQKRPLLQKKCSSNKKKKNRWMSLLFSFKCNWCAPRVRSVLMNIAPSMKNRLLLIRDSFAAKHKDQPHTRPHILKEKKKRKKCESVWVGWKWCNFTFAFFFFFLTVPQEKHFFLAEGTSPLGISSGNLLSPSSWLLEVFTAWDRDFLLTLLPSPVFLLTDIFKSSHDNDTCSCFLGCQTYLKYIFLE